MTTTELIPLSAVAARPGDASLDDLARLRRADRAGVPDGSFEITDIERATDHVLDLIRATREQSLPEARAMAEYRPDEPAYAAEVDRLHELIRRDSLRALVLGASLTSVCDATRHGKAEVYALRQELVSRGFLLYLDSHLA